jgi:hypothetical protein
VVHLAVPEAVPEGGADDTADVRDGIHTLPLRSSGLASGSSRVHSHGLQQ